MQNKNKTLKSYSEEQDIKNIKKMREILASLPPFCRQYFRGIETTTSARTRLGYAYDLRIFFEFLHENNPSLNALPVTSYKISLLNDICKDDIEEYMEYLSYYENKGVLFYAPENRTIRSRTRIVSVVIAIFVATVMLVGLLGIVIPQLIQSITVLLNSVPSYLDNVNNWINQMQAVMIPIDEYERLKALDDMSERKEIYETVQARKNTPAKDYVSYEDALKQAGL